MHAMKTKTSLFILTLCTALVACAPLHAEEPSINISLGIRDTKFFMPQWITNTPYPLAFRIKNTGKTVLSGGEARNLFLQGYIHVLSKDGKQEDADCKRFEVGERYGFDAPDVQPGAEFESGVVVNLLTIFPLIKDDDYQVWWTRWINGLKSNILHFRVTDGKLQFTTATWAKDYHLVATQLRGAPASGTPAEFPVVYVLLFSNENSFPVPSVYTKFDSEDMRLDIRSLVGHGIAPGSVLHFDSSPDLKRPTDAEIQSLTDYCKKLGISFVVTPTL